MKLAVRKFIASRRLFTGPITNENESVNTNILPTKKKFLKRKRKLISLKTEVGEGRVVLHLPIETVSEANNFDHWTKKHARHKLQKRLVAFALNPLREKINLPCEIRLTRIAPRLLDCWDNLPMSVKYVLDAVCATVTGDFRPGRADDNKEITVRYNQECRPEYGVIVELLFKSSID